MNEATAAALALAIIQLLGQIAVLLNKKRARRRQTRKKPATLGGN